MKELTDKNKKKSQEKRRYKKKTRIIHKRNKNRTKE